jgi:hypothetical protein
MIHALLNHVGDGDNEAECDAVLLQTSGSQEKNIALPHL